MPLGGLRRTSMRYALRRSGWSKPCNTSALPPPPLTLSIPRRATLRHPIALSCLAHVTSMTGPGARDRARNLAAITAPAEDYGDSALSAKEPAMGVLECLAFTGGRHQVQSTDREPDPRSLRGGGTRSTRPTELRCSESRGFPCPPTP